MKPLSDKILKEVLEAARAAGGAGFEAETGVYVNGVPDTIFIPAKFIVTLALEVEAWRKKRAAKLVVALALEAEGSKKKRAAKLKRTLGTGNG